MAAYLKKKKKIYIIFYILYRDRMPPVQQTQSWNFPLTKYSTAKVEAIENDSNAVSNEAMKW